jgi:peroxiredoxin
MKKLRLLIFLSLAGFNLACPRPVANSSEYGPMPAFSVKDIRGTTISSDTLKGKVVVVNFWATWCPPCRAEIPDFVAFYDENKSKGVEIVGFSVDDLTAADLAPFVAKFKMTYPVVLADRRIVRDFDPGNAIPTTFLIDKQGRIRHKQVGLMEKAELESWFLKLAKN